MISCRISSYVSNNVGKCLRQVKWVQSYSRCVCNLNGIIGHGSHRKTLVQSQDNLLNFTGIHCRNLCSSLTGSISLPEYEVICNETLESLTDYFDVIVEENTHLENADVTYGDGVLTVNFGNPHGTYVINRQTPNKQIWLSSPTSGPKRYDFDPSRNTWIYKHDNKSLHDLLQEEIVTIVMSNVDFYSNCSHSGKHR
ncbi:hypothetical protein M8J75_002905 [Diaphorina citri]|nr:hypothetical protein M8J75_002905 [Diaphorina citri]